MRDFPAMDDWIARARRADIWVVLNLVAPHHTLKPRGLRGVGPCPACGGTDRFSIDRTKGLFYCRRSATGGDAIALVEYLTGANFLGAVETITGEAPPVTLGATADVRRADPKLIAQRRLDAAAEAERRSREGAQYRDKEIARAATIWKEGVPLQGSPAESYLRLRGLEAPAGARLRGHGALKFWQWSEREKTFAVLHEGPALLARIDDAAHHFIGCHCTWIDLRTWKGKAVITDPDSGELLPVKKVRGSQKGGHIHLGGDPAKAAHLIIGEGIETVLSVREALRAGHRTLDGLLFWTSVNLGNLGGPSAGTVFHPTQTRKDRRGRTRRAKVPGPVPDMTEHRVIMPPPQVTHVTLLGDGDSDRFTTECVLHRAAARWAAPHRIIKAAWPGEGQDFNSLLMEAA